MKKFILLLSILASILSGCGGLGSLPGDSPDQTPDAVTTETPTLQEEDSTPTPATAQPTLSSPSDITESILVVPGGPVGFTPSQFFHMYEDEDYWYCWTESGIYRQGKTDHINTFVSDHGFIRENGLYCMFGALSGWLYYVEQLEDASCVEFWRMDNNGENKTFLFDNITIGIDNVNTIRFSYNIFGNYLHVSDTYDHYFFYIDVDGSFTDEPTFILDGDCEGMERVGEKLYYTRYFSLYEFDLETKTESVLLEYYNSPEGKSEYRNLIANFVTSKGEIYFYQREPYGIYRYADGERKLIFEAENSYWYLRPYNGKLYFDARQYLSYCDNKVVIMQYDQVADQLTEFLAVDNCLDWKIMFGIFIYWDTVGNQYTIPLG